MLRSSLFSNTRANNIFTPVVRGYARRSAPKPSAKESTEVISAEKDLPQSPMKMKFLVAVINNLWVPDALAQLKFSAKHRAVDVAKILNRACVTHGINHGTLPQELIVTHAMVTKGFASKRMTIMGKGGTGLGYTRRSHVQVGVDKIDFAAMIEKESDPQKKKMWEQRWETVKKLRNTAPVETAVVSAAV